MNISDQPGRIVAIFVISPILAIKAVKYEDWFIFIFALILFGWDLYWILTCPPKNPKNEF